MSSADLHAGNGTDDLRETLGQAVLDFGMMEAIIRTAVITLSRDEAVSKALIPPGNPASQNLELLRRICRVRVHPVALPPWLDAIDDILSLLQERNRIFHGIFYEQQKVVLLARVKKGKGGVPDSWDAMEFSREHLNRVLSRLHARRRQLMDFVDDYSISDDGPPRTPSQEEHESLSILGTPA